MSRFHKINPKATAELNSGFGNIASSYGGRFLNKGGTANIERKGIGFLEKVSWYHTMLLLSRWKFLSVILLFYFFVNIFFGTIYFLIGVDSLNEIPSSSTLTNFAESFFFSTQTFTTVGFGRISPVGFLSSSVAAIEALLGLLSLALATGLLYGRFSKPVAYLRYSHNALISPYKDINALMFRVVPFKNTGLVDVVANVSLGMTVEENGEIVNKFFPLDLEMNKLTQLALSWTLVHPITEKSPIYNFTATDFENIKGEILVIIRAFDDKFSNIVVSRTSYVFKEIFYGGKFDMMFERDSSGEKTVIYIDKVNSFRQVPLNNLNVSKTGEEVSISDAVI